MISGHPVSRTSASASASASLSPPLPSSINTTTSATPTAASASPTIRSVIRSCPPSSRPPLSTTKNSRSPCFARAKFRSRVVPGIALPIALDFDDDFQKPARAKNFFELEARRRADLLERAPARANQHAFVRLAIDDHRRADRSEERRVRERV